MILFHFRFRIPDWLLKILNQRISKLLSWSFFLYCSFHDAIARESFKLMCIYFWGIFLCNVVTSNQIENEKFEILCLWCNSSLLHAFCTVFLQKDTIFWMKNKVIPNIYVSHIQVYLSTLKSTNHENIYYLTFDII